MQKLRRTRALLLNDSVRKGGTSKDKNGDSYSWSDAYVLSVLPLGSKSGSEAKKVKVRPDLEEQVKKLLAEVPWGSVVSLDIEDNAIIDVIVEQEWVEPVPLD